MTKLQNVGRHGQSLKLHRNIQLGEVSNRPVLPTIPILHGVGGIGEVLPVPSLYIGIAPYLASKPVRRGGARNSAYRETLALTADQVRNLKAATLHASVIGLPFTRMISVHWQAAGVSLDGMTAATGRYLDLMAKAIRRHGFRTTWLWVHENGDGKGGHCHVLAHVPPSLIRRITTLQKSWLKAITDRSYKRGVVCSRPVGGRVGLETGNPAIHALNLDYALSYVLKGADNTASEQENLTRIEPGGRIIGKRCGVSQNIGPKARKEYEHDKTEKQIGS
jgi:hypothetical protein